MGSDEVSRRGSNDIDEHAFAGWDPTNELSEDDREAITTLVTLRARDHTMIAVIDARLKLIEGELVPMCECGWRGRVEGWMPPSSRRDSSHQFISHKNNAHVIRIQQEHDARVAASALEHVAAEWTGEVSVAQWLRAQADRVRAAKVYDGQHWPHA
ncbi:hypothetical protein [Microbacterium gorillae]|uniref:hypothetical protein n=1 Tax=Microbacterium gorillae TaxID=1231063 RepID=UPI003D99A565